jgi:hypothetical protein
MLHSVSGRRKKDDSRLLVVGSQTANLTPSRSFAHNLGCRCPNGSCEAILDIYTSRPFQWYKTFFNERCFDPCNLLMNFQESQRTPNSHFQECEWRPHTSLKVGLRHKFLTVETPLNPLPNFVADPISTSLLTTYMLGTTTVSTLVVVIPTISDWTTPTLACYFRVSTIVASDTIGGAMLIRDQWCSILWLPISILCDAICGCEYFFGSLLLVWTDERICRLCGSN